MNIFEGINPMKVQRSKFDLSHEAKLTFQMGELVPTACIEIVPGDKFKMDVEALIRFAPMLSPMMHRVDVTHHVFFVPTRIIWTEFERFITGGEDGSALPVSPFFAIQESNKTNFVAGSLSDYLGVPVPNQTAAIGGINISSLPHRAYLEIYNQYYRDQNLQPAIVYSKGSGQETVSFTELVTIRRRCWEKDYFTSCLPFQQRGTAVSSPIQGIAALTPTTRAITARRVDTGAAATTGNVTTNATGGLQAQFAPGGLINAYLDVTGGADMTTPGVGVDVNALRRSIALQAWLERQARGGGRYVETILNQFRVRSSDARLQRPEYLGGTKTPVVISEVLSTFQQAAENIPQGNMAGHGVSTGQSRIITKEFEEHGFLMVLTSVMPKTAYQQGIPKKFLRTDKFDYLWPALAHLGEQAVSGSEVFYDGVSIPPSTFGWQSRYAEYKYESSRVHGDFKTSLSFWHMGRIFTTAPALNSQFVTCDPTQRVFAVTNPNVDKLYCQMYFRISALRPLPYYDEPRING